MVFQQSEEGTLALPGNIHMSMFNIHAACAQEERDDDHSDNMKEILDAKLRLVT